MRISISGHTAGIGKALAKVYADQGHEIIGISRREGNNIRNLHKIMHLITPADMFINNAQSGFGQAELLEAVWKEWKGDETKTIINISTMMTLGSYHPIDDQTYSAYVVQKKALEQTHWQLRAISLYPSMVLVKPGAVATQPGNTVEEGYADVDIWANGLFSILNVHPALRVAEVSLGPY